MTERSTGEVSKYYRYLSVTKVNRLIRGESPLSAGGFSLLGIGGNLTLSGTSLRQRLDAVLKELHGNNLLGNLSTKNSIFIAGTGLFVEYLMSDVVIWIAKLERTILLLGGSSRNLNFDNFGKNEVSGIVPGSNRTAILNAVTTLWRTAKNASTGEPIADPCQIKFWDSWGSIDGRTVRSEAHDDIPYPVEAIVPKSIANYMGEARAIYDLCPDYFIDNLEYAAVVYKDYTFPEDVPATTACKWSIQAGERLIIGSPLYVAQLTP